MISIATAPFTFPKPVRLFQSLHILTDVSVLFWWWSSPWLCGDITLWFDWHFRELVTLCISRVLIVTSISLFEKYLILCPFLNILLLLWSCRVPYMFWTLTPWMHWFADIFFFMGCLPPHWFSPLICSHFLSFMSPVLSIFSFGCLCFWCHIHK